jgi:fructosamine-3-kinase
MAGEAAGLRALAATATVRVPQVLGQQVIDDDLHGFRARDRAGACLAQGARGAWLATEWLADAPASEKLRWEALGQDLARLHECVQPQCGFEVTTHCGPTPQDNRQTSAKSAHVTSAAADARAWFGERRLLAIALLGYEQGAWPYDLVESVMSLQSRLPELVPFQVPVVCHGDLWSGNVVGTAKGLALIDPAVAYGPAEADLALVTLFGGFPEVFLRAYEQSRTTLASGWRQRLEIYQVFHLMNHWLLFGGGYAEQTRALLRKYVG